MGTKLHSISFVMPMYNEAENIEATLGIVRQVARELAQDYEIIVVDDASTDRSADIVTGLAAKNRYIKIFRLKENTKFGGAFAECLLRASKDVIIYIDSDMPVRMEDIKAAFPFIHEADIVTGYSRYKKGDTIARKIISFTYNFIVRLVFGLNIKDINSGFKVLKRSLIQDLEFISLSPFIDVELFIHARKKDAKVRQYPLVFHPRRGGKSYIARLPVILATLRDMCKVRVKLWKQSLKRQE